MSFLTEIQSVSTVVMSITIVSGLVIIYIIGNSGCNRVVATYNDGLGLAYTF